MRFCCEAEDFETEMKSFYTDRANGLGEVILNHREHLETGSGGIVLAPDTFSVFS